MMFIFGIVFGLFLGLIYWGFDFYKTNAHLKRIINKLKE